MKQRVDLFTPIHKAIRSILYEVGGDLQSADMSDPEERKQVLSMLRNSLELLAEHARHEDEIIFPPIEKACPGVTVESVEEHRLYENKIEEINRLIVALSGDVSSNTADSLVSRLRHVFVDFIAFYLLHMNHEEEAMLEASIAHLSPDELLRIRVEVQKDTDPDRYSEWLQWMLPSLDMRELVELFTQVSLNAPEAVYQKFREIGQQSLGEGRWLRLSSQLPAA